MKHKVFKLFYDFEKEERWLNEMSAEGLQFSSYWSWTFATWRHACFSPTPSPLSFSAVSRGRISGATPYTHS